MTWTKLSDGWTDSREFVRLSHADRWHYLTMIQYCSRTMTLDGIMSRVNARRCSDVPDADGALKALEGAGLIQSMSDDRVLVLRVDEHLPSPDVIAKSEAKRENERTRQRRSRAHKLGNHDASCEADCDAVRDVTPVVTRDVTPTPRTPPVTRDVTPPVHGDSGTGRDGSEEKASPVLDSNALEAKMQQMVHVVSSPDFSRCHVCRKPLADTDELNICDRSDFDHVVQRGKAVRRPLALTSGEKPW